MIFNKGDKIGSYTVTFPHKQGRYADTYRVKDAKGTTRFLKLIDYSKLRPSQLNEDGNIIEAVIANMRLRHHNLCDFIDSGNIILNGKPFTYIVSVFISGETLSAKVLRDASPSVYEIKTIAKTVLNALDFLHRQKPAAIIHNEITPQNIMISFDGVMQNSKLIDFGHARFINMRPAKPDLRELNAFYMAPERLNGISSVQSDLFSVGAVMYNLLYGQLPWFIDLSGLNGDEMVEAVLAEREKPIKLPLIDKFELDEQLLNVISKAMNYDSDERFQSANEFIQAIDGKIKVPRQATTRQIAIGPNDRTPSSQPKVKKGEGFAAIAGMEDLKQRMMEEVIEPLRNPDKYKAYGITIPNGMLLYGPPGCGKTFFARHFAEEAGFNFMDKTAGTIKSRYVNATEENIAHMFKEAEENAPTIIYIDEIDTLVPNRQSDIHEMSVNAVNEMLGQMDRTGEKGVFVIGACNFPDKIDPAMLRAGRLENKYYVGPPDKDTRMALFKLYLKKRPYDFGLDYELLADLTKGYVSADISKIVNDASRMAFKQNSKITMQILKNVISNSQPSLNAATIAEYEKIKNEFEGNSTSSPPKKPRPRVGFV